MKISPDMFGQHIILTKDMIDQGGPFDRFTELTSPTSLRYPGGSVTENLSPHDGTWDAIFDDPGDVGASDRVVTVKEAFSFAQQHDAKINFVLPTEHFFKDGPFGQRMPDIKLIDDMISKVSDMLNGVYGKAQISSFEIGNEYWGGQDKMTAAEYGRIADTMAKSLQEVFNKRIADGKAPPDSEPSIAVQSGAWWKSNTDESDIILDELSPEAREVIDSVVAHHYPRSLNEAKDHQKFYNNIEKFTSAEGFDDLDIYISEWNVGASSGQIGFSQIPGLLSAFDQMVSNGVDAANVWGTQYKYLVNRLGGMSHNPEDGVSPEDVKIWFTPAGEAYRILQDKAIGKQLADLKPEDILNSVESDEFLVNSYTGDNSTTIFLSSKSSSSLDIDLDVSKLIEKFPDGHIYATMMSAQDIPRTSKDEGDPVSSNARAKLSHIDSDEISFSDGKLQLSPHGTVVITVTKKGVGVNLNGQESVLDPEDELGEIMTGGSGNDTIRGNAGDDTVFGGDGNDILLGGSDDDLLSGGAGSDVLVAGEGYDTLIGGEGRDAFISSKGDSKIETGVEGDVVVIGGGSSKIVSNGADFISIGESEGVSIIGFDASSDYLAFGSSGSKNNIAAENLSVEENDLVVSMDGFGRIVLYEAASQLETLHALLSKEVSPEEKAESLSKYFMDMTEDQGRIIASETFSGFEENIIFEGLFQKIPKHFSNDFGRGVLSELHFESTPPPLLPPIGPAVPIDQEEHTKFPDGEQIPSPELPPVSPAVPKPTNPVKDVEDVEEEENYHHPHPDEDLPEEHHDTGNSGGCFIATASFGDGCHPDVLRLRRFRDDVLVVHPAGRAFITTYWILGPYLAKVTTPSNILGRLVRKAVSSFVKRVC